MGNESEKTFNYTVLDVFTETRYNGNQLAVIQVDQDLEKELYERISREFSYSETSFARYSQKDKALKIRSFTSAGVEIDGAGHHLLGAVSDSLIRGEEIFREQAGIPYVIMKETPIYLEIDDSAGIYLISLKQRPAVVGKTVPVQKLVDGLSIKTSDFSDDLQPTIVSTAVTHLMVPLINIEALDKINTDNKLLTELSKEFGFEGFYCFGFAEDDEEHLVETRFFNPLIGIDEDPATGSAAGPLAGFLQHHGYLKLDASYKFLQGKIMGRTSIIRVKVTGSEILVSGSSVVTMQGKIFI